MKTLSMLAIGTVLLGASLSAFAHHGFAVEYDRTKQLTLVGKLTMVDLENPHGWLYIDAEDLARQDSELGVGASRPRAASGETVLIRASTRP